MVARGAGHDPAHERFEARGLSAGSRPPAKPWSGAGEFDIRYMHVHLR